MRGHGEGDGGGKVGYELVITRWRHKMGLDEVPLAICSLVQRMKPLPSRVLPNDRGDPPLDEEGPQSVAVINGVGGETAAPTERR